jgi:hypothetical protein
MEALGEAGERKLLASPFVGQGGGGLDDRRPV